MAILEVEKIRKDFGSLEVLRDVSFSLEKGETLSMIGASGSGKTTLLRCLNFLERPTGGVIRVGGEVIFNAADPATTSESEIRRRRMHFGMVFQSFNLFPQYTALQNVTLARELKEKEQPGCKEHKKEILNQIREEGAVVLDSVGLKAKMDYYPHQLSGGQQQRVAIARALATKPAILLADEPTGNLDSRTSQDVLSLMKVTGRKYSQTMVMITHNEEIAQLADRVIRIEDGRIQGSPAGKGHGPEEGRARREQGSEVAG